MPVQKKSLEIYWMHHVSIKQTMNFSGLSYANPVLVEEQQECKEVLYLSQGYYFESERNSVTGARAHLLWGHDPLF